MTTTEHTPGPWNVGPKDHFREGDISSDKGWVFQRLSAATDADSALVAAAPDLLEACERLLGFANHYGSESAVAAAHGLFEAARAAIVKAKGV